VDKATAATTTRREYPEVYRAFQQWSGVAKSYGGLVQAEINRGFSPLIAKQRIMHAHGIAPLDLNKCADSPVVRFFNLVTKVMERDNCGRTTAMRKIRRSHPTLMKRLNMMEV
jgi:hypothetical protein